MPPILGAIIYHKLATLNELKTIYTYDDALLLYDIICVNNYNDRLVKLESDKK